MERLFLPFLGKSLFPSEDILLVWMSKTVSLPSKHINQGSRKNICFLLFLFSIGVHNQESYHQLKVDHLLGYATKPDLE